MKNKATGRLHRFHVSCFYLVSGSASDYYILTHRVSARSPFFLDLLLVVKSKCYLKILQVLNCIRRLGKLAQTLQTCDRILHIVMNTEPIKSCLGNRMTHNEYNFCNLLPSCRFPHNVHFYIFPRFLKLQHL